MADLIYPTSKKGLTDATVTAWFVAPGQPFEAGQDLVHLAAERSLISVQAPTAGSLGQILADIGQTVRPGEVLARLADGAAGAANSQNAAPKSTQTGPQTTQSDAKSTASGSKNAKEMTMAGDVTPILMPKAGNSMEEGTILGWKVKVGDAIEVGQVIVEVETDKAAVEVEAMDAGRLARIIAEEGDIVPVLEPIAFLAENDADVDAYLASQGGGTAAVETPAASAAPAPQAVAPQPATVGQAPATPAGGRAKASPAARKVAEQRGVDLTQLPAGSGPGGRILSTDVPAAAAAAVAVPAAPMAAPAAPAASGDVLRQPMSKMRRAIGTALQTSKQQIPHFYIELTVDAGPLSDFYRLEKAKYKLSLNDIVVRACGMALAEFPAFRSRIEGNDLVTLPGSNIGVAVGTDAGLVVPVVLGVEGRSLPNLAAETRRVVEAARGGKIEGYGQGVMTISNLGMFGVTRFNAIINPPEASILAVGGIREEVIVSGGTMRPGKVMTMTLSADHRVVDGLVAAKFLARLKTLLEGPNQLA